ncbi:MAG TPA: tRNA preQ1(34) S-adenosylmethionine ribosyltransferase-isomerase QueA [Pyrinomonadaceae bacterium]|nr:tRNA preQ1(34) S-adenosylmethionine ribosyltransferase-isomerase QueA [Pyrinomonadaceae bacterium]
MLLSDFDYDLPEELIAQEPLGRRDASRMLVVNRGEQKIEDSPFAHFPDWLREGDLVVVNNTRVFPARLIGHRNPTGGRVEVLLVREQEDLTWEALVRPAQRLKPGDSISFGSSELRAELMGSSDRGMRLLRFGGGSRNEIERWLFEQGQTPLPPYIRRPSGTTPNDQERYQTVFARERGAVAAPTAGLHFTPEVIESLRAKKISMAEITLHVGYGTFEPVRVENIEEHHVAPEFFRLEDKAAAQINGTRQRGGRVIAVGTTTTRALESSVSATGQVQAGNRETSLTITPGFKFQVTDALLTNFHLPRSSLLLLVSAFAGREFTLQAYRQAVASRFRFYSYGDCMFVI